MRVTDLEKFALEHIWRPYWADAPLMRGPRPERLPMGLGTTVRLMEMDDTGWTDMVVNRLAEIGVDFPDYVQHPLVDFLRQKIDRLKNEVV